MPRKEILQIQLQMKKAFSHPACLTKYFMTLIIYKIKDNEK